MAGNKSEERVKKPSLQGGVEQVNEIWHRAISNRCVRVRVDLLKGIWQT